MTQVIDYTRYRLNSKPFGLRIVRCPKCGRKGELGVYDDGSGRVFHEARREAFFLAITDSCMLKEGELL